VTPRLESSKESGSLALAPGARHLGALGDLPFDHQPIPRHAPKMDPAIIQGPDLVPGPNLGPVPIGVHVGTAPARAPTPAATAPGADLVAGSIVAIGATATLPCLTAADTLATGLTLTPTFV